MFHENLKVLLLAGYNLRVLDYYLLAIFGIERIEEIGKYKGYVYDFMIPGNENFLANNIFVHNTKALQALLILDPPDYK